MHRFIAINSEKAILFPNYEQALAFKQHNPLWKIEPYD